MRTRAHVDTVDVTERVRQAVRTSGIAEGICVVAVLHTTAGIFVNESADSDVHTDLVAALERMIPADERYLHAEGNAPGHIKSVLVGTTTTIPLRGGSLDLGRWQGIYIAEFDGPRDRNATITVIGDPAN